MNKEPQSFISSCVFTAQFSLFCCVRTKIKQIKSFEEIFHFALAELKPFGEDCATLFSRKTGVKYVSLLA